MYPAAAQAIDGLDGVLPGTAGALRPALPERRPEETSLEPGDPLAALLARIALGE